MISAVRMVLLLTALLHVVVMVSSEDEPVKLNVELAIADAEPDTTILFPWFTEALGIIVFFVSMTDMSD